MIEFLQNPQKPPIYIDTVNWPENKGCSGYNEMINLRDEWNRLNKLEWVFYDHFANIIFSQIFVK